MSVFSTDLSIPWRDQTYFAHQCSSIVVAFEHERLNEHLMSNLNQVPSAPFRWLSSLFWILQGMQFSLPWGHLSCIWKKSNIPNFSVQRGGKVRKLKEGWGPSKTGNRKIFPRHQCPCLIVLVGKLRLGIRCSSWLFGPNSLPTHSVSREHSALLFWGQNKLGGWCRSCSHAMPLTSSSGTEVQSGTHHDLGLQNGPHPSLSGSAPYPNVDYWTHFHQRWWQGARYPNASSERDKAAVWNSGCIEAVSPVCS